MAFLMQTLNSLLTMPIVLYSSVLTVNEIVKLPLEVCTSVIGGMCILYTMVGGFPTIIWTDVVQSLMMLISFFLLVIMGVLKIGGIAEVYRRADAGGRLHILNLNPNPLERLSLWSCMIGMGFLQAAYGSCTISSMQRIMACPNLKHARKSILISSSWTFLSKFICLAIGITLFAYFSSCDPIKNQEIDGPNKLLPHYALSIFEHIPGLIGIFVTGHVSAGLSTISSELNALAAVIYYEIIQKLFKSSSVYKYSRTIVMVIIFLFGCIVLSAAPYIQQFKSLFQVSITLGGIFYGIQLGLMLLGIMFPWANSKGAFAGMITSMCLMTWLGIGSLKYNIYEDKLLTTSVESCSHITHTSFNITDNIDHVKPLINFTNSSNMTDLMYNVEEEPFFLYRLSSPYYNTLNCITLTIVGMSVSYITGFNDIRKMDARLIFFGWRKYVQPNN